MPADSREDLILKALQAANALPRVSKVQISEVHERRLQFIAKSKFQAIKQSDPQFVAHAQSNIKRKRPIAAES